MKRMRLSGFPLLIMGLALAFYHPCLASSDVDSSTPDSSESLQQAQDEVRNTPAFHGAMGNPNFSPPSLTLQAEDPAILKSLCLFEKGVVYYLGGNPDQTVSTWDLSLQCLSNTDPAHSYFERRSATALAMLRLKKATRFEEIFRILETVTPQIRDYPLPAESAFFPEQQRMELALITSDTLFKSIRSMSAAGLSPSALEGNLKESGISILGDDSLFYLLSFHKETGSNSPCYEQIVDGLVFKGTYNEVALKLGATATELCGAVPSAAQGSVEALILLWGAQFNPEQLKTLWKGLPFLPAVEHPTFAHGLASLIRLAEDSGQEHAVKAIGLALPSHEADLAPLSPAEKIDLANLLVNRTNSDTLLRLVNSVISTVQDPELIQEAQMLQLKIFAQNNRPRDGIAIGEALLNGHSKISPEIFYFLGISYAKAEDATAAIKNLSEFIDKAENDTYVPPALELLGKLYLSKGQIEKARVAFHQLIYLFPNSPSAKICRPFLGIPATSSAP